MKLLWLADALRAEGCTVEEHVGWKDRSNEAFAEFSPVGLINHHTGGPKVIKNYPKRPFYRNVALERKCNLTIRPDGVVVTLNAGWAADSGFGDEDVLAAVRADKPAPKPDDTYIDEDPVTPGGVRPGMLGNAFFIDIEVQHLGNGDPINPPQREALILANAAICKKMGWDPMTRLIGHREWSKRKKDPNWDGNANPMPQIRLDTAAQMEDAMTPEQEAKLDQAISLLGQIASKLERTVSLEQAVMKTLTSPLGRPVDGVEGPTPRQAILATARAVEPVLVEDARSDDPGEEFPIPIE